MKKSSCPRSMSCSVMLYKKIHDTQYQFYLRSLNGRFLNIELRLPDFLIPLESEIKQRIAKYIKRGSIFLMIKADHSYPFSKTLDIKKIKDILNYLQGEEIKISHLTLSDILNFMNINKPFPIILTSSLKKAILKVVDTLVLHSIKQKEREGKQMKRDLEILIDKTAAQISKIEKLLPSLEKERETFIQNKILEFNNKFHKDAKIELEKALFLLYIQKSITEELTRLKYHITNFKLQLERKPDAKELEFLTQEMNREITTLLNKAENHKISAIGVKIKKYIEDMKEILANME
jgi:uncharacterized protein (TIGR00255 family)